MKAMPSRLRRISAHVGAALVVATIVALITRGAFEAAKTALVVGTVAGFVLLLLGALLSPFRRAGALAWFLVRAAIVMFLAMPCSLVTSRGVVAFDLWRAQRYIEAELVPRIEAMRTPTYYDSDTRKWTKSYDPCYY